MTSLTLEELAGRGHSVWAEISLQALRHNVSILREMAPQSEFMGVVKSYAYGHGNPTCARVMIEAGASRLGVARVAEAIHLRDAGIEVPIHVFSEPAPGAIPAMLDHGLTPTVYTVAFAGALSEAAAERGQRVPVHLKVDTGMNRVGVLVEEFPAKIGVFSQLQGLEIEGVWSHMAVADRPADPFNQRQLDAFNSVVELVEKEGVQVRYRHIANSAATMALPASHFDIVRCGVACYGLWPGMDLVGTADLRPVMRVKARVNMVKRVPAGDGVSYGLNYRLAKDARLITVGAGYADGYDRRLSGTGDIIFEGRRFKVSGTVCMDQFMVDIGDEPAESGSIVTLLGADGDERIAAEELAERIGTINYEVTSRLPSRVPRVFIEDEH
ncbi:MAG: alanine racemase [Actinomycetota bacterium]